MRRFLSVICLLSFLISEAPAGEYRLTNNDLIKGAPVSFNEEGFVVQLDVGGYTPRIGWNRLTQESLKEIAQNYPGGARYAEPWIIVPPEVKRREREQAKQITIREPERVERPESTGAIKAFFTTPAGLTLVIVLFLANLYAAYEIAVFKNRPAALVVGLSAILPVVAPILFLVTPEQTTVSEHETEEAPAEPSPAPTAAAPAAAAHGLSLSSAEKGQAGASQAAVYKRGDTTFNRRFFETKFSGFFRVVPSEAEKDLVLAIKLGKTEHVSRRITRISMTDVHLQLLNGSEVSVTFPEISEVHLRPKDAK